MTNWCTAGNTSMHWSLEIKQHADRLGLECDHDDTHAMRVDQFRSTYSWTVNTLEVIGVNTHARMDTTNLRKTN